MPKGSTPLHVYFDPDCGVCGACVRFAQRRDPQGRLLFHAGVTGADPVPSGMSPAAFAALARRTVVAWAGPQAPLLTRHEAIAAVLSRMRGGWPGWLARVLRTPGLGWLFGRAYDAFAARRHRVSAALGMGVCGVADRMPSSEASPSGPSAAAAAAPRAGGTATGTQGPSKA